MPPQNRKVIRVSRKASIVVFIILVLGLWFYYTNMRGYPINNFGVVQSPTMSAPGMKTEILPTSPNAPMVDSGVYPYPYQGGTPNITDTREFLKVAYQADIKTRDVKSITREVKSAINDVDGRIDNFSESVKYGYVSFVVPKGKFSDFQDEIESLTHEKLITESTSSQNLLSGKQSIEAEQKSATELLATYTKQEKDLTAKHNQTVTSLQKQITIKQKELATVQSEISHTSDQNKLAQLRNQEASLQQQIASLQQNLNSENSTYAYTDQSLKNQISYANSRLANANQQDTNFTNNIETVSGYITVNWVSLWTLAKIFSPVHPTIVIILLALALWYWLYRKNYLPGIEFV